MTAQPMTVQEEGRWAAWDRFVSATPHSGFMQSSWWADLRARVGFGHFAAILRHRGAVVAGAVVLTYEFEPGCFFYYVPEGPVVQGGDADFDLFDAVLTAIVERPMEEGERVSHLRIEPRLEGLPDSRRAFRPVPSFSDGFMEPRHTICVDLRPPESGILAQMKPKGRYNIGIAQRHGVSVIEDASAAGLRDFLSIYEATTDRHSLDAKPPDYFADLLGALQRTGHGSLYFAEHQGRRLAAAIVVWFGRRATYFFGGSLGEQRHVMAPYLLHYEIMRLAKTCGCESYDLWGVAPADELDHPWQNISVFKRKFGGREVRLVPTLDYVIDAEAYARYLAAGES